MHSFIPFHFIASNHPPPPLEAERTHVLAESTDLRQPSHTSLLIAGPWTYHARDPLSATPAGGPTPCPGAEFHKQSLQDVLQQAGPGHYLRCTAPWDQHIPAGRYAQRVLRNHRIYWKTNWLVSNRRNPTFNNAHTTLKRHLTLVITTLVHNTLSAQHSSCCIGFSCSTRSQTQETRYVICDSESSSPCSIALPDY